VYGARAIITSPQVQADFPSNCPITSTCGGLAYVGVLDAFGSTRDANGNAVAAHPYYEGAFINAAGITNPLEVTTIVSHEVGHNAGLNHAGLIRPNQPTLDYYSGTGNWGPIMGTPYNRALSQWTQHSYSGANNDNGPDLPILANNGIASRADDTGQTLGTAVPTGWTTRAGSITAPTDQDLWSLGRCTGTVTITATPSTYSTNLDVSLTLYTEAGGTPIPLASVDPASGQSGSGSSLRATGVSATFTQPGRGATYYALVRGSASGPDGGYGNLGPYTLNASCAGASLPPATFVPPAGPSFTDVPTSSTFHGQIEWLSAQGVSTGYDNGNGTKRFEPSAAVLREQMAAFLARYADASLSVPETSPFTDVASSHVFLSHIAWLAGTGVSTGYANGDGTFSFRPGQPVLREQMAAFLYRLAGSPSVPPSSACSFTDVPSNHVFRTAICWLAANNISTGYADGTFRPGQPVLREQMAAFLFRYDAAGLPVP
ncbi:S-layer homology domain-containing protein, partial [Aeromicrobium alkaliterrae]|uniref:S-layer homology domain-containing protein n=1 Tax=Aeromicrobium alkaliterrae TaxID=302168 RepID=UPI0031D7335C